MRGSFSAQAVQPIGSYGLGDLGDCFGTKAGVSDDRVKCFLTGWWGQSGEGLGECFPDLVFAQMWCGAGGGAFVFVVAPPDVAAVFAGGMPGFTPVPSPALPALDPGRKGVGSRGAGFGSPGDFCLYQVPRCRVDDRLVVTTHVVLGHLALVGFDGLGQEISSEGFL